MTHNTLWVKGRVGAPEWGLGQMTSGSIIQTEKLNKKLVIVCYLHNPIQIFLYKISICFFASRRRSGLMVLKALTLHQKDGYMNTSMTTIYYLYYIEYKFMYIISYIYNFIVFKYMQLHFCICIFWWN